MLRLLWVYLNASLYVLFHIIPIRRRYKHPENYSISEKFKHVKKTCDIIIRKSGADITVLGRENLIEDQAVLYVANHASMIDPYFVSHAVVYQLGAVIAGDDGYEKIPVLAPWFQSFGSVYVDRSNPREGVKGINQAIKNVKKGHSLVLFPEGEITSYVTDNDSVAPFHTGGLKIATKGKVPVIPISIIGTNKLYKARSIIGRLKKGQVKLVIHEPYMKHLDESINVKKMANELREIIKSEIDINNKS